MSHHSLPCAVGPVPIPLPCGQRDAALLGGAVKRNCQLLEIVMQGSLKERASPGTPGGLLLARPSG